MGLMISRYRLARVNITELAIQGLSSEEVKDSIAGYKKAWEDFEVEHKKYLAIEFAPGEAELYEEFKKSIQAVKASMDSVLETYEKGAAKGAVDYATIAQIVTKEVQSKGNAVRDSGNKLMAFHVDRADLRAESADKIAEVSTLVIIATIGVGSAIGVIFAVMFSNGLVSALSKISDSLNEAGIQVSAGSNQIASTAQELSQSNTEQSASLEETAASIEEMSSMIQKSADNAKRTFDSASSTKDSATHGRQVVTEMIGSIEEINASNQDIMGAIEESNKRMEEIVTVIGEIENKTKVINDIVFQTKLLSFNASVEAARAGEMGKGFAVVAEEVGNLAQMSGNAAKEISEMLSNSMTKVSDIIYTTKSKVEGLVENGKRKVDAGTVVAKRCGDVLETIVKDVDNVTRLANEISEASDEQSKGIQEISKATAMLGTVTQQNSLASEESAKASEDLSRQALELRGLVTNLVQTIHGGSEVVHTEPVQKQHAKKMTKTISITSAQKKVKTANAPLANDARFEDVV